MEKYLVSILLILLASYFSEAQNISINKDEAASEVYRTIDLRNWPSRCESFSSKKGYGFWAKLISNELKNSAKYAELLEGTEDIFNLCPQYPYLKMEDRFNIWVFVLLNMAYFESSCDSSIKAEGPNGVVAGLLQLHSGQESIYSMGCRRGDAASAEGSIRCSLSMLRDQIRRDRKLFSNKSYWEVLRPNGHADKSYLIQASLLGLQSCRIVR